MNRSSDRDRANSTEGASAKETEHNAKREQQADERDANPPRTSTGRMTSPKFGSATSGGGEIEPGPERD